MYVEQFQPEQAIRFSMAEYREQDWLVNVPLYAFNMLINEELNYGLSIIYYS